MVAREVCRHLGMAGDAQRHEDYPSPVHRCHLWSLRDQIDVAHQRHYCLTDAHRRCPWLSVPPPGFKPADRSIPKGRMAASGGIAAMLCGVAAMATTGWSGGLGGLGFGGPQAPVRAVTLAARATLDAAGEARDPTPRANSIVRPFGALSPTLLTSGNPETVTAALDPVAGGTILAGNVGLSFSPKALSEAGSDVTVHLEAQPKANVPGGPAQFSPNGTIVDITVRDRDGKLVTTFPEPVDIVFKYNSADLAMARGDASVLSAAYVLDHDSPELENPLHFPVNTWVFFPPSNVKLDADAGTISVKTQAIGSIMSVVAIGVGWGQTLRPDVQLHSSFDPATSTVFGTAKQFSYLRVLNPQIGSRLFVLNPETDKYAYVNARDLGPSGPPPPGHSTK